MKDIPSYLHDIANGITNFCAEMKISTDKFNAKLDKVLGANCQVNHEAFPVATFEDEIKYLKDKIHVEYYTVQHPEYLDRLETAVDPTSYMANDTYVIIRGNLKSGKKIRYDETKFNQLYINGKRYTSDYTFNGETHKTYERLTIVLSQVPYNVTDREWGHLIVDASDFPIENAEIFVNIGRNSRVQPEIEELLLTDTVDSLYVNGDWAWKTADYSPIRTLYVSGILSINSGAFYCRALLNAYLPNTSNVPQKSNTTTYRNIDLSNATGTISDSCFANSEIQGTVFIPKISRINQNAFAGCKKIINVVVGEGLVFLGRQAFQGCTSLLEFEVPDAVTTSDNAYTFENCSNMKKLTIGNGMTTLGTNYASNCTSLEVLTLGNGLTSASEFAGCFALKELYVRKGYKCKTTIITAATGLDWRCFKEVLENCAVPGENGRATTSTSADLKFRVSSKTLVDYNDALVYEGDDAEKLQDKEIAQQIADLMLSKQVSITT